VHFRTTNSIESTFATVRLRTAKKRWCVHGTVFWPWCLNWPPAPRRGGVRSTELTGSLISSPACSSETGSTWIPQQGVRGSRRAAWLHRPDVPAPIRNGITPMVPPIIFHGSSMFVRTEAGKRMTTMILPLQHDVAGDFSAGPERLLRFTV
jgi:hypothetical protein